MPRAKSIQIYLKQGIEQDDLLLALWSVCRDRSRPQEIFRKMLLRGFETMRSSGELSDSMIEAVEEVLKNGDLPPPPEPRISAPSARNPEDQPSRLERQERPASRPVEAGPARPPQPQLKPAPQPQSKPAESGEGDAGKSGNGGRSAFIGDIM